MSVSSALHKLASYRANNSRQSWDVLKQGTTLLKAGKAPAGDDG